MASRVRVREDRAGGTRGAPRGGKSRWRKEGAPRAAAGGQPRVGWSRPWPPWRLHPPLSPKGCHLAGSSGLDVELGLFLMVVENEFTSWIQKSLSSHTCFDFPKGSACCLLLELLILKLLSSPTSPFATRPPSPPPPRRQKTMPNKCCIKYQHVGIWKWLLPFCWSH